MTIHSAKEPNISQYQNALLFYRILHCAVLQARGKTLVLLLLILASKWAWHLLSELNVHLLF